MESFPVVADDRAQYPIKVADLAGIALIHFQMVKSFIDGMVAPFHEFRPVMQIGAPWRPNGLTIHDSMITP